MILNRNNYEEFFLLYVDNELSDAERKAVDAFLRQNPDLESEMHLLQQTKMKPENNLVFEHKELLLKHEGNSTLINHINYQEFFLLYVDGELDEKDRKMVEEFASKDSFYHKEFFLFLQTRIEPDPSLIFEGKESLFRKSGRIGLLPRVSIAAAVLLFIVGGYFAFILTNSHKKQVPVVIAAKKVLPPENKVNPDTKIVPLGVTPVTPQSLYPTDNSIRKPKMENKNQQEGAQPEIRELRKTQIPEADNPTIEVAKINDPIIETGPIAGTPLSVGKSDVASVDHTSPAEFKTTPEDGDDQPDASEGKSKMRGLFRKVSRVFGKTASAGQETGKRGILIGGFQIALK